MIQALKKEDLTSLTRFDDQWCRLQKIGSKHNMSAVISGQYEDGEFSLYVYEKTDKFPEMYGAFVQGRGFSSWLRSSPIVKIVDQDEESTTFETVGGIYRLTKRG